MSKNKIPVARCAYDHPQNSCPALVTLIAQDDVADALWEVSCTDHNATEGQGVVVEKYMARILLQSACHFAEQDSKCYL